MKLLCDMHENTRNVFVPVFIEDLKSAFSAVMVSRVGESHRVTFTSLYKLYNLAASLNLMRICVLCEDAFAHSDTKLDEWPEVIRGHRPGCWCTVDIPELHEAVTSTTECLALREYEYV